MQYQEFLDDWEETLEEMGIDLEDWEDEECDLS
jgi:hypothetical protein